MGREREREMKILAGRVEQTDWYNFYIEGKNKKQNSSYSNQVHNYPLCKFYPLILRDLFLSVKISIKDKKLAVLG